MEAVCGHITYAKAVQVLHDDYNAALATGRFIPLAIPGTFLNLLILVGALYITPFCTRQTSRPLRYMSFAGIVIASTWSLIHYRAPGVVGSLGVGLNAFMCTVLGANFLVLRDPRDLKRASPIHRCTQSVGHRQREHHVEQESWMWEAIPDHPWQRLCWILDLLACLRALKWSRDPQKPSRHPSPAVQSDASFCRHQMFSFVCSYLALDVIKCLMIADPYFLGFISCPAPRHLAFFSTLALRTYRLLLAGAGVSFAIQFYFSAWALLQIYVLGPRAIGLNGQTRMYPPLYGSLEAMFERGLQGFWGQTWHQIFRMHFSSIGDAVAAFFLEELFFLEEVGSTKASGRWTAVRISTVFLASGLFHACGSYTLLGATQPLHTFLCFAAQPMGIAVQMAAAQLLRCIMPGAARLPWVRRSTNFILVLLWLPATLAPLADEFSSGGMWLFEPVPVSIVRGFGFSNQDSRWLPLVGRPSSTIG